MPSSGRPPDTSVTRTAGPAVARRHDLDALRAAAMTAGLVVHATSPMIPYWAADDPAGGLLYRLHELLHGFRMPLFFLLSGFFTTMLLHRRGLGGLLAHRCRRIVVPFALSLVTILPLVIVGLALARVLIGTDSGLTEPFSAIYGARIELIDTGAGWEPVVTPPPFSGVRLAHLWFLWQLILILAVTALVAEAGARLRRRHPPEPQRADAERSGPTGDTTGTAPVLGRMAWLAVPATIVFEAGMTPDLFGPDTSEELLPNPLVLGYYGAFFAFGALAHRPIRPGRPPLIDATARLWPLQLLAGLAVYPVERLLPPSSLLAPTAQALYAWLLIFGTMGLARWLVKTARPWIRWVSDSAYWVYLIHLPILVVMSGVVARLQLPGLVAFPLVMAMVMALSFGSYQVVRPSPVGTLLHGPRPRSPRCRRSIGHRRTHSPIDLSAFLPPATDERRHRPSSVTTNDQVACGRQVRNTSYGAGASSRRQPRSDCPARHRSARPGS